jgi:hypothetical protein
MYVGGRVFLAFLLFWKFFVPFRFVVFLCFFFLIDETLKCTLMQNKRITRG